MNKNEIFEYLDALRESGEINMYEGSKYLMNMFGLNRHEARGYLIEWMQTYAERMHSDKGYEIGTKEGYDAFIEKRNGPLRQSFGEMDDELKECVKEFFEKYLHRREESDGGRMFAPIYVSCCRSLMVQPLGELLNKMRILSGAEPEPKDNGIEE